MNLSENIKNAFNVIDKTYENVDKLRGIVILSPMIMAMSL